MALQFKSLLTRTLTAAVFVGVLLTCIFFNYISFTLLFLIVSIWGLQEFYEISEKLEAKPFRTTGVLGSIFLYLSACAYYMNYIEFSPLNLIVPVFFTVLIAALFSQREKPVRDALYTIGGIAYAVAPFILLNGIACISKEPIDDSKIKTGFVYNSHFVLGPILLIWANDTFAYLCGSLLGKHKMYERISPGKTWEGTIGGAILTMASVYLIAKWYPELSYVNWLAIAAIMIIFGTIGDLTESMLKRQAGIKDSGKIMPGHGGILDRFDSLLFAAPFVYAFLVLIYS
jgi:phosphatidate cytidylyltransferase